MKPWGLGRSWSPVVVRIRVLAGGAIPLAPGITAAFSDIVPTLTPRDPGPRPGWAGPIRKGLGPATIQAILSSPGRNGTITLEDVIAAMTRPIRLYDLNGDGLSADELAIPGQIAAARMRAQSAETFLPFDLNGDQQVTRQEFDIVSKAGQMQPGNLDKMCLPPPTRTATVSSAGTRMTAMRPGYGNTDQFQQKQQRALTLDIDPTPDTNFTLADAKTAADSLMALYDLDHNGVIDPSEIAEARTRPR